MIELTEKESKYFDLMEDRISIKEFERWVYNSKWLEEELKSISNRKSYLLAVPGSPLENQHSK